MKLSYSGRAVQRALAAAIVAAAVAPLAGIAVAAGSPGGDAARQRAQAAARHHAETPAKNRNGLREAAPGYKATPDSFPMNAVSKATGRLNLYYPNHQGGFDPREEMRVDYRWAAATMELDNNHDGSSDGTWDIDRNGLLTYSFSWDNQGYSKNIGGGWQIYDKVLSPGNLAGAGEADMIARDKAGVLWLYLGYADGRVTARTKVGGGWGQYTEIAGQGDLTGDGKADIVARDRAGVLWLYKGTGNRNDPFEKRTKIGGGWNTYNRILSVGDLDGDGRTDLIARANNGDLYRYSGNSSSRDPFNNRVKIGYGFNSYNLI